MKSHHTIFLKDKFRGTIKFFNILTFKMLLNTFYLSILIILLLNQINSFFRVSFYLLINFIFLFYSLIILLIFVETLNIGIYNFEKAYIRHSNKLAIGFITVYKLNLISFLNLDKFSILYIIMLFLLDIFVQSRVNKISILLIFSNRCFR